MITHGRRAGLSPVVAGVVLCLLAAGVQTSEAGPGHDAAPALAVQASATATPGPCAPPPASSRSGRGYTVGLPFSPLLLGLSERTGHLFAAGYDVCRGQGAIAMLDPRTGRVLGTVPVGQRPFQVLMDEPARRVLLASGEAGPGAMTVLDAQSGRVVHVTQAPSVFGDGFGFAVLDEHTQRAFVPTTRGVVILDAPSGRILRSLRDGVQGATLAMDEQLERVYAAVYDDTSLTMLDSRSGTILRTADIGDCARPYSLVGMAADGRRGRLFTGTLGTTNKGSEVDGSFCVLDARTGRVLHTVNNHLTADLVAVDEPAGMVLVGSSDSFNGIVDVAARSTTDGHLVHVLGKMGYGRASAPPVIDPRSGAIYGLFGSQFRTLREVDPHTWRSRVLARRVDASALALGSRTHRLFIASQQQRTVTMLCLARSC